MLILESLFKLLSHTQTLSPTLCHLLLLFASWLPQSLLPLIKWTPLLLSLPRPPFLRRFKFSTSLSPSLPLLSLPLSKPSTPSLLPTFFLSLSNFQGRQSCFLPTGRWSWKMYLLTYSRTHVHTYSLGGWGESVDISSESNLKTDRCCSQQENNVFQNKHTTHIIRWNSFCYVSILAYSLSLRPADCPAPPWQMPEWWWCLGRESGIILYVCVCTRCSRLRLCVWVCACMRASARVYVCTFARVNECVIPTTSITIPKAHKSGPHFLSDWNIATNIIMLMTTSGIPTQQTEQPVVQHVFTMSAPSDRKYRIPYHNPSMCNCNEIATCRATGST